MKTSKKSYPLRRRLQGLLSIEILRDFHVWETFWRTSPNKYYILNRPDKHLIFLHRRPYKDYQTRLSKSRLWIEDLLKDSFPKNQLKVFHNKMGSCEAFNSLEDHLWIFSFRSPLDGLFFIKISWRFFQHRRYIEGFAHQRTLWKICGKVLCPLKVSLNHYVSREPVFRVFPISMLIPVEGFLSIKGLPKVFEKVLSRGLLSVESFLSFETSRIEGFLSITDPFERFSKSRRHIE